MTNRGHTLRLSASQRPHWGARQAQPAPDLRRPRLQPPRLRLRPAPARASGDN